MSTRGSFAGSLERLGLRWGPTSVCCGSSFVLEGLHLGFVEQLQLCFRDRLGRGAVALRQQQVYPLFEKAYLDITRGDRFIALCLLHTLAARFCFSLGYEDLLLEQKRFESFDVVGEFDGERGVCTSRLYG